MRDTDWAKIRGFNYQPGIGSTSYENWIGFDPDTVRRELADGKRHFPGMNTVRIWLSYDAYLKDPGAFMQNMEIYVGLCAAQGLKIIPCLFNRWHNTFCDNDGLYLDHFVEGSDAWLGTGFYPYIDDLMQKFACDERIILWDLCNEPFSYNRPVKDLWAFAEKELEFLHLLARRVRKYDPETPIGVSLSGHDWLTAVQLVEPFTDVLLIHPYWMITDDEESLRQGSARFKKAVGEQKQFAVKVGKPLLATETCWGSSDPKQRCENMRVTLDTLCGNQIGFLAHALTESPVADLHELADGPLLDDMGVFYFVKKDGTLREGHELFNEYCSPIWHEARQEV